MDDYNNWRGKTVYDRDGNKIGPLSEIYVDDRSGRPAFATVSTGLFGTKENFFPISIAKIDADEDRIVVDAPEDQVKNAPKIDVDEMLNPDEERTLYQYYEQDWGDDDEDDREALDDDTDEDAPRGAVGHDTSGPTTDEAMTRSEEKLEVGTERRETGRVRLKKYVVTEHVTTTVPVQREEVRIEREPITEDNIGAATDGPAISEEEHEVVLHAEVPVVEKKTVPVERVRLGKTTVQDQEKVEGDVRKEKIDVDGDVDIDKDRR